MNVAEKVKEYISLRGKKAKLESLIKAKVAPIKTRMIEIENELLKFLNETGQRSSKTSFGTPYKAIKKFITVSDSEKFFKFVKDTDAFDLLHKKVATSVYDTYIKEGIEVPGITETSEIVVHILKS